MDASDVKPERFYLLEGTPSICGLPAVQPEVVYVVKQDPYYERGWYIVQFNDGGRLCMHASRLSREVTP